MRWQLAADFVVAIHFAYVAVVVLGLVAILIVFFYAIVHIRNTRAEFIRLATATGTKPISTGPFAVLTGTVGAFWLVVLTGWVYILLWLK